jgi:hypothetical protein
MCLHIFAPGKKIQIDYAAESISLKNGGSEALVDLLITNHSTEVIDRLHIVYPHAIPLSEPSTSAGPAFTDITDTWLSPDSIYNDFYGTPETLFEVRPGDGYAELVVKLINPSDIRKILDYKGYLRGPQNLTPYAPSDSDELDADEWKILSELGFSVFSVKFAMPIAAGEARWLRLRGQTGLLRHNRYIFVERWARRLCGQLVHRFEIAGPLDVHHRIVSFLRAAGVYQPPRHRSGHDGTKYSMLKVQSLQHKLLSHGLEADNTETVVKDWRVNVFDRGYRRVDEPISWGDIRPCGGLYNTIRSRSGRELHAYQWKAGHQNAPSPTADGKFGVRIRAQDIPLIVLVLPWLAFALGVTALLSRPDVLGYIAKLWPFGH